MEKLAKLVLILMVLSLSPRVASGQVVQVQGGASSIFDAQGGTITLFMPASTWNIGAGVEDGTFVANASTQFDLDHWHVTLGDRRETISSGNAGLALGLRGIEMNRSGFGFFSGSCGRIYTTPFFQGSEGASFCVGYSLRKKIHKYQFNSIAVLNNKTTAIETLSYRNHVFSLSGSGGLLENQPYLNGLAELSTHHVTGSVGEQTYAYQGQLAAVQSEELGLSDGPFSIHGGSFQSHLATGQTAGANVRIAFLGIGADQFWSGAIKTFSGRLSQNVGRFSLSEYVTRSEGRTSLNFGGGVRSNLVTANVSLSEQFFPFSTIPFQNVLSATLSFQLPHNATMNLGAIVAGKQVDYTAYGSQYVGTPTTANAHPRATGKVVVQGIVQDPSGIPVEGAAVQIGNQLCFSDSAGRILIRFRNRKHLELHVLLNEFSAPGAWNVVSAPQSADEPFVVILKRMPITLQQARLSNN